MPWSMGTREVSGTVPDTPAVVIENTELESQFLEEVMYISSCHLDSISPADGRGLRTGGWVDGWMNE